MRREVFMWGFCCLAAGSLFVKGARGEDAKPPEKVGSNSVTVRVAAVSFVPKKFDLAGNADRLERAFRLAKKGDAKIAVAPEGALDGYVP